MNIAVILAGGTGTRVGANIPKQFIEIQGKPVLAYTLDQFQKDPEIDAIEVVCHKDWIEEVRGICGRFGITKLRWLTAGGSTFQESTMNGIFHLKGKISPEDIVVVSFGVSPLCTPDIINDSIRIAKEHGNAISGWLGHGKAPLSFVFALFSMVARALRGARDNVAGESWARCRSDSCYLDLFFI